MFFFRTILYYHVVFFMTFLFVYLVDTEYLYVNQTVSLIFYQFEYKKKEVRFANYNFRFTSVYLLHVNKKFFF